MADRGGTRRTSPGRGHPRVSVPELPAPRGRQRRPHAHRPLGRPVAVDPTGQRLGGALLVAAAGGRECSRGLPCRHRGDRRRWNADPAALRRPSGRPVADPERIGPRRYRLSDSCGHEHARRGRFDDPGRERDPTRVARRRTAARRSATDRPSASSRGPDTAGCHADADTQPDSDTDRESLAPDQRDTFAQPDPDARALAVTQPEPVMRQTGASRERAVRRNDGTGPAIVERSAMNRAHGSPLVTRLTTDLASSVRRLDEQRDQPWLVMAAAISVAVFIGLLVSQMLGPSPNDGTIGLPDANASAAPASSAAARPVSVVDISDECRAIGIRRQQPLVLRRGGL